MRLQTHTAMDTINKIYPTEPTTEKKAVATKSEPKIYYAEEVLEELLEVSDRHMLWSANVDEETEWLYDNECRDSIARLSAHYHTPIGCYGRSGRHVCIPDTPANRRNYRHIVKAVRREQDRIIELFK